MASVTHLVVGVLLSGRSPQGGGGQGGRWRGGGALEGRRRDAANMHC